MKVVAVLAALVVVAGDEAPLAKADLHEAPLAVVGGDSEASLVELHRALSSVHSSTSPQKKPSPQ